MLQYSYNNNIVILTKIYVVTKVIILEVLSAQALLNFHLLFI